MSPNWCALIYQDYQAVFPLPEIRKYFIFKSVLQPPFTPSLGWFGVNPPSYPTAFNYIKKNYTYWAINFRTNVPSSIQGNYLKRTTQLLDLNIPFLSIQKGYSTNTSRNLKKALKTNASISEELSIQDFVLFRKNNNTNLAKKHFKTMSRLLGVLSNRKLVTIKGIKNQKNELIAAVAWVKNHNTWVYLLSASTAEGKSSQSMFLLIDSFIKDHSETETRIDFEGSMIPGIARFFKGFGSIEETYYRIQNL